MPVDNPKRRELEPLIAHITHAYQLRTFNRALGLAERDLDTWPVDFVESVLIWGPRQEKG